MCSIWLTREEGKKEEENIGKGGYEGTWAYQIAFTMA